MLKSFFECAMIICFGLAWPLSIYKSWTSRSTGGKSLFFLLVILLGYMSGLIKCYLDDHSSIIQILLFGLYILNTIMVSTDVVLYFRNRLIEKKAEFEAKNTIVNEKAKEEK